MSGKVPKTGLSGETTVHQHVKTIYAEERGITLTAREDIQRWVTKSYVAYDIGWLHKLVQCLSDQILSNVIRETRDGW